MKKWQQGFYYTLTPRAYTCPTVQTTNATFTAALLKASLGILLRRNLTSHPKPEAVGLLPPYLLCDIKSSGDICFYFCMYYSPAFTSYTLLRMKHKLESPVMSPCAVAGSNAGLREAVYLQGAGWGCK